MNKSLWLLSHIHVKKLFVMLLGFDQEENEHGMEQTLLLLLLLLNMKNERKTQQKLLCTQQEHPQEQDQHLSMSLMSLTHLQCWKCFCLMDVTSHELDFDVQIPIIVVVVVVVVLILFV